MRFFHLCAGGALTLEVLSRGVNFATALKHDASKASSTTELVRKDTRVSKEKRIDDSFPVLNGHRSLEAVDPEWQTKAANLWATEYKENYARLSISADGKTFVMSHYADNVHAGRVRVYSIIGGEWKQKGEDIVGEESHEQLGAAVAISADGSILAISIWRRPIETKKGCIKVYKFENNAWNPMGGQIDGEIEQEHFGWDISLSDNGLIVAGSGKISTPSDNTGLIRVFQFANNQWDQLGGTIYGDECFGNDPNGNPYCSQFGYSLSLSGSGLILAAGNLGVINIKQPSLKVFQCVNNEEWTQMGQTVQGDINTYFGWVSQISGDASTVIVGATGHHNVNYVGHVRVFRFIDNQWKQLGQTFGWTSGGVGREVSISSDGNMILISDEYNPEVWGANGAVRVYEYSGSQWEQLGGDIYGNPVLESGENFGRIAALSASGYTLVAAGKQEGASVFKLPIVEEWDGAWFIYYDSVTLSGNVLTSTYLTKPGVESDFTVSHTIGACDSNGAALGNPAITNVVSTAIVVDDEMNDTLSVAKTLNATAIAEVHGGELNFCETVTLTNTGEQETETVDVVQAQSYYTVKANFLAEIGTYSPVTLVDDSSVTTVDEQSLSPEGTIAVKRCADLTDSINPGDKLCLEIYVSDSQSVGVDRIHNLDLKQGTSTFAAIADGLNQYSDLVAESCVDGTCTVDIVVPDSLFTDESGASELTLFILGDAYLYVKGGAKDEDKNESKGFSFSVQLERPCTGGLRGFVENMLSP